MMTIFNCEKNISMSKIIELKGKSFMQLIQKERR